MPRVVSYLDDNTIKELKELYRDSNKPLSQIISELVSIGYKVKQYHDTEQPEQQEEKNYFANKHTEYLLKIMAIATDVYRYVRNKR
jgi:N-acetyl-anhydromuramyl-L-alanine amidase AmpD